MRPSLRTLGTALIMMLAGPAAVHAQVVFPTKPIRVIVPFPPGGTTDVLARAVSNRMGEALGQSVVIENKPGAGGNIGADALAKAAADGHTLLLATPGPMAINASLYKNLPFNPEKDFAAVGQMITIQSVLITSPGSSYKSLRDVLTYAKANPGKLAFASPGSGTTPHLAGELLKATAAIDLQHVAYKGDAPAIADLMGGHVPLALANLAGVINLIKDGKLRAIAVAGPVRSALLPETPTIAEAGVPGFAVTAWAGLVAPAGTAAPVIARLNAELNKALASPEVNERMTQLAAEVVQGSPEQFQGLIRSEQARWSKVIRDANIKLD